MTWFDNLPPIVRHSAIAFFGAAFAVVAGAVASASGVTGVDWGTTVLDAVNAGFVALVAAVGILFVTPLTKQYGFFKGE